MGRPLDGPLGFAGKMLARRPLQFQRVSPGAWSVEGVLVHAAAELRETLPRYEARLALDDLETDLDDAGQPIVIVRGHVTGTRVVLTIDPLRRCVRALRLD